MRKTSKFLAISFHLIDIQNPSCENEIACFGFPGGIFHLPSKLFRVESSVRSCEKKHRTGHVIFRIQLLFCT